MSSLALPFSDEDADTAELQDSNARLHEHVTRLGLHIGNAKDPKVEGCDAAPRPRQMTLDHWAVRPEIRPPR